MERRSGRGSGAAAVVNASGGEVTPPRVANPTPVLEAVVKGEMEKGDKESRGQLEILHLLGGLQEQGVTVEKMPLPQQGSRHPLEHQGSRIWSRGLP
eukprot:6969520-Karenia_brevis.AAC.1